MKKTRRYGNRPNRPFRAMQGAAIGLTGLAVTGAVISGVQAQAPAGTPNMSVGFNTLAGFAPIAVTATVAKSLLPKYKKNKIY